MASPSQARDTPPSDNQHKSPNDMPSKKVIIIGAGISGLLLAQYLRKSNIPFSIFECDADFNTRGAGWGLTLHWSLPALRFLLPKELVDRLPETYVDQEAVERGETSTFPFFDLATGELKGASPKAPESQRIRVTREKFRQLLATGIEIHWGKTCNGCVYYPDTESIVASFEDGSACFGGLLAGCDGTHSRIRKALFPESEKEIHKIPVGVLGVKVDYTPEQIKPLRELDPFFFQGTSSETDTFIYFSMLDAPGNNPSTSPNHKINYTCQIVVSWPLHTGFFGSESIIPCPSTNQERLDLIRTFAETWAEPFRSLVLDIPEGTEVKPVEINDWAPPSEAVFLPDCPVALLGDAFHPMAMYRGEGANHAILDVLDFVTKGATYFWEMDQRPSTEPGYISYALERYGRHVIQRARPAVLASRRACMDAHDYKRIGPDSPLLSRRMMKLEFEDESLGWE